MGIHAQCRILLTHPASCLRSMYGIFSTGEMVQPASYMNTWKARYAASVNGSNSACVKGRYVCACLRPGVAIIEAHPEFIVCLH